MAISLYDATVATFAQGLGGLEGVLKKGADHCAAAGVDPATIVEARLHPDMLPFWYQVQASVSHSVDAVAACRTGEFPAPRGKGPMDYAALQAKVVEGRAALKAVTAEEVEAMQGRDVKFVLGPDRALPFTAENFLLSFSVPNFFFHVTTAYDILRQAGAPLSKGDFIGRPRLKV